jgi:acetyl-CoA carboxylase carboxyl transferase subunit alpha
LGIGIGDRVSMLEHSYYSVISPEGCAGILWKVATETTKPLAAEALRMTGRDLKRLGVIDDIIPEPLGGAHRDHRDMANTLKTYLIRYIRELRPLSMDDLLTSRYQKFRKMGYYLSGPDPAASAAGAS